MLHMTSTTTETALKPYTMKELAALYGVSNKTLKTWLQPHQRRFGERRSRYFTVLQVRIIFECLGPPLE